MTGSGRKRILFHLLGDRRKASSRVRGWWIADELARRGHQVAFSTSNRRRDYLRLAWRIPGVDVILVQKRYSRYDLMLVRLARLLGKRCLFDIDDAPSRAGRAVSMRNARRMMALCDTVLVGGSRLAELARAENPNVRLVPSSVPLANYAPHSGKRGDDPPCLGWIGNGAEYADDLIALLRPPLVALAERRPLRLRIVGGCGVERLHRAFENIPGLECEIIDDLDWGSAAAVAEAVSPFEIGLYPLLPSAFNEFKCAFKAVEYMALALPVIASDVAANADVVVDGETGLIVRDPAGWEAAIEALLDDPARAEAMGRAGRARAEAQLSIDGVCDVFEDIFAGRAR